jgi:hypothetical protein
VSANGDKYEGEWRYSMKHGKGTEQYHNGDIYIGNYREGLPNGFGKYVWADKGYFEGTFVNGQKTGLGKWTKQVIQTDPVLKTRKILKYEFEGHYKYDKKEGHGVFKWPSDGIYEGGFKADFRHGFGVMRWADGTTYEGEWENGV